MSDKKRIIYSLDQVADVAKELLSYMDQCAVYTFTGPLGAGKTELVRAMLRQCGIAEHVASPTFTYVNLYENARGQLFYHFDLYRITSRNDFVAAGFDEYLYQPNSWTFIEWPKPILPLLTHNVCHVTIDYYGDKRELTYEVVR